MISIQSRSGVGQEFEFEFNGYMTEADVFVSVPESKTFQTARLMPGATPGATSLRWALHGGEHRLVVAIGSRRMAFDDAPEDLRKALNRWVERLANVLRKGRYV